MWIRIGRVVLDSTKVDSVVLDSVKKTATVHLQSGRSHVFKKYAQNAWSYFKGRATKLAGE